MSRRSTGSCPCRTGCSRRSRYTGPGCVGVNPRAAFAPFFALSHEEWLKEEAPGEIAGGGAPCTSGGSDGDAVRVIQIGEAVRIALPDLRTAPRPRRLAVDLAALAAPGLPATLRGKARRLGVSHEAVRQGMKAAGLATDLGSRNARIREMALAGVPWRADAAQAGLSPSGVRAVCRGLPGRGEGGRPRR
jgi:hypothetical protein